MLKTPRQIASRYRKSFGLLSALLIVGSMAAVWLVLEVNRTTDVYLVASKDLATGTAISASTVATQSVSLFGLKDTYLLQDELPSSGYLLHPVAKGELLPKSALSTKEIDDFVSLVVGPALEVSSDIGTGSKVQLWTSPFLEYGKFGEPYLLAMDAEIVELRKPEGAFANQANLVEVRIPVEAVQTVLRSVANGDSIAIVSSGSSLSR